MPVTVGRLTTVSGVNRAGLLTKSASSVRVYGVPQAIRKFARIGQLAARDLGLVVYRTAQHVQKKAQILVPYVTGALHDGIELDKSGVYDWFVTASSIAGGADREYAAHVEKGTRFMSARPYLAPALSEGRLFAQAQLKALAIKLERI